jgi:hypothetical protein
MWGVERVPWMSLSRELVERSPVQASEELYKAAEEAVKALAHHFGLSAVLEKVEKRGRWTAAELEKAVEAISEGAGGRLRRAWGTAWARASF